MTTRPVVFISPYVWVTASCRVPYMRRRGHYIAVKRNKTKRGTLSSCLADTVVQSSCLPSVPVRQAFTVRGSAGTGFAFAESSERGGAAGRPPQRHGWADGLLPTPGPRCRCRLPGRWRGAHSDPLLASRPGGGTGSPVSRPSPSPATITGFQFQPRLAGRPASPHSACSHRLRGECGWQHMRRPEPCRG